MGRFVTLRHVMVTNTNPGGCPAVETGSDKAMETTASSQARVFTIIGFVMAAIALVLFPPVFGVAGVVLGVIGHSKGDPLGKWAAVAAVVAIVLGMILSAAVLTST